MLSTIFVIGVDKQTLDKLRICSEHFSEDMVLTYTSRRVLKDCARPVLNLPVDILQENVNMDIEEISENVQSNPDLESMSTMSHEVSVSKSVNEESVHEEDQGSRNQVVDRVQLIKSTPDATLCHLRKKVRLLQKRMHKQKKSSQKKRQEIRRLRSENKWEEITADLSGAQKIFLETINANLYSKPQVIIFP